MPKRPRPLEDTPYAETRAKLDSNGVMAPSGRKNRSALLWAPLYPRSESKINGEKIIKPSQIVSRRRDLMSQCKLAIDESVFLNYVGINQGREGACSLVGFLNLCTIQGVVDKLHVPFKHKTFTRCDVIKFWGNIWDLIAPYSTNRNGMDDIASLLDAAKSVGLTKNLDCQMRYFPIRSYAWKENMFNAALTSNPHEILESVRTMMMALLDNNVPFLVNCHEHTRVCVGYTDSEFVFADSWGNDSAQIEIDVEGQVVNRLDAGFSFAPISLIVSYTRDVMWFDMQSQHADPCLHMR